LHRARRVLEQRPLLTIQVALVRFAILADDRFGFRIGEVLIARSSGVGADYFR